MSRRKKRNNEQRIIGLIIFLVILILSYFGVDFDGKQNTSTNTLSQTNTYANIEKIPKYAGEIYVYLNDNKPEFEEKDYTTEIFEEYSKLDSLGRCGRAYANICKQLMPKDGEQRESISEVIPTGWVQEEYNGEYLYNRCHLIGYQLAGENANELNLITGTRYFNVSGMLPFENEIAQYIEENENNHVLFRVTPIYEGDNLVANGVQMEAYSVEDNGKGVCFNVYVYNVQPGVHIDYATGKNWSE